jgi:hypothetical protein
MCGCIERDFIEASFSSILHQVAARVDGDWQSSGNGGSARSKITAGYNAITATHRPACGQEAVIFGKNGLDGQFIYIKIRRRNRGSNDYLLPLPSLW